MIDRARNRLGRAKVIDLSGTQQYVDGGPQQQGAESLVQDMDVVMEVIRTRISAATKNTGSGVRTHADPALLRRGGVQASLRLPRPRQSPAIANTSNSGSGIATFLIYLNDEFEGGETQFPDIGIQFRGRRGTRSSGPMSICKVSPDPLTRHAGFHRRQARNGSLAMDSRPDWANALRRLHFTARGSMNCAMAEETLEQAADKAAAAGDFGTAKAMLEQAAVVDGSSQAIWMKLSAMRKASGDLKGALAAVDRSLAIQPLDFSTLLYRAVLLDTLGDPSAGEEFGKALAQAPPDGELPPPMLAPVLHARKRWQIHQRALEEHLSRSIPEHLSEQEKRRAERFISNNSRKSRHFHQEPTNFHYPELPEIEFHDRARFPELKPFEAKTDDIRREFEALIAAEAAEMVPYIQYPERIPLAQWKDLNKAASGPRSTCCRMASVSKPTHGIAQSRWRRFRSFRQPRYPRRFTQRHVLASRATHENPAPYGRREHPARLPFAADRAARLRLPLRRDDG